MGAPEAIAILLAGGAAGLVNTVVGSGTLLTFPVLLAFGYPPVVANVSNTIGLVPGSVSGAWGYRAELAGQRRIARRLGAASIGGGVVGSVALLVLPASAFRAIVPAFIAVALILILVGPRLNRALARRGPSPVVEHRRGTATAVAASGVYGGYFGAAQGILLLAILGIGRPDSLQRNNALKVVLAGLVNLAAGVAFAVSAPVAWVPAGLIAAGSVGGGLLGVRVGRRLPPGALRALIVIVGVAAIARLVG